MIGRYWCFALLLVSGCTQARNVFPPSSTSQPRCSSPLGMESGAIADDRLSASSSHDPVGVGPASARLNRDSPGGGAWCPDGPVGHGRRKQFLQVDLGRPTWLAGSVAQGRFGAGAGREFAESYALEYWRAGMASFEPVPGGEAIEGNSDTRTAVTAMLPSPVVAEKVRVVPRSDRGDRTVCMRVELLGCPFEKAPLEPTDDEEVSKNVERKMEEATAAGDDGGTFQGLFGEGVAAGVAVGVAGTSAMFLSLCLAAAAVSRWRKRRRNEEAVAGMTLFRNPPPSSCSYSPCHSRLLMSTTTTTPPSSSSGSPHSQKRPSPLAVAAFVEPIYSVPNSAIRDDDDDDIGGGHHVYSIPANSLSPPRHQHPHRRPPVFTSLERVQIPDQIWRAAASGEETAVDSEEDESFGGAVFQLRNSGRF